jgi:hypothetical protein
MQRSVYDKLCTSSKLVASRLFGFSQFHRGNQRNFDETLAD